MPPIHLLNELRYLVPTQFESKLLRAGIYDARTGWTNKSKDRGLLFDLSRLEWVEFGTLVQLVLLIESALMNSIAVSVALPIGSVRESEEEWIRASADEATSTLIHDQVNRRRKVLDFLAHLRFEVALRPHHLGDKIKNLTILRDYDPNRWIEKEATGLAPNEADLTGANNTRLYQFFFPLTWLSTGDDTQTQNIAKFLAGVIGQPERGLEAIDADAISNVILYELVDNVSTHAGGSGHALVAAWARSERSTYSVEHYIDCERSYIEWLSQRQVSSVEIVVGDSGKGVPAVLTDAFQLAIGKRNLGGVSDRTAKILHWAFDRWSSSRANNLRRGTRGLYRVDRVVSKYQGIVTIRAHKQMAGWDHGGLSHDEPVHATQSLSYFPGSILRCRMPSFREDLTPRLTQHRAPRDISFDIVRVGMITHGGISDWAVQSLKQRLSPAQSNKPLCVVAIVEGGISRKNAVEATLRRCVEIRHPGTLVIFGLPGSWSAIEICLESINAEHEKQARDTESKKATHFEVWDPVLVVGPQGQFGWVGANERVKAVLDHLLNSENGRINTEALRELIPDEQLRASVLKYLWSDTNLVRFEPEGQGLELLITGAEIIGFTLKRLEAYLELPGSRDGILTGDAYRTPSLLLVNKWLNVESIVEKTCGYELVMFALSDRVKRELIQQQLGLANTILADSTVSSTHQETLQKYLGASWKETIPGEAGAPVLPNARLLRDRAKVVVYCDVIAASEAVGRCLRQIRREGAEALAVVCVVDARKDHGNNLRVLDMDVPVICLTRLDVVIEETPGTEPLNINPITRSIEESQPLPPFKYEISHAALDGLIDTNKALHFSHIGRPIGRHFTFYLNALPIFNETRIIGAFNAAIDSALNEWRKHRGVEDSEQIEIWYPSPEPKPSEPARRFAEIIKNQRNDVQTLQTLRRVPAYGHWVFTGINSVTSPTVVIIDWGALTGSTVTQAARLAGEAGARFVLVCVFLSQLGRNEELFLRSLQTIRLWAVSTDVSSQSKIPLFEKAERVQKETAVMIKFLAGFPIEAYQAYECPVCQQLSRLSQEEYPTELLESFAAHQKDVRLRLRTREGVLHSDPKDFDDRLMASESTLWMVYFRGRLVDALASTGRRQGIKEEVDRLLEKLISGEPPSEVLWLLHFLSIESQWLRRPPLYFRQLRENISQIALLVARDSSVEEADRLNAIIVLRTSNKGLFAKHFADLFLSSANSEQLIKQLLYDVFTYVNRPYHQTSRVFSPIKKGLQDVQDMVANRRILLPSPYSREITETVDLLLMRSEAELAKAGVRLDTPVQAWAKLRTKLSPENYHPHDEVPQAILFMLPGPEAAIIERKLAEIEKGDSLVVPIEERVISWLQTLKEYWKTCCKFLDFTVLPLLARLRPVLLSRDANRAMGFDVVEELLRLIDELARRAPVSESEFSEFVNRVSENPREMLSRENWEKYKKTVKWFREGLLLPKSNDRPFASRLIEFLMSAPAVLGATVKQVYQLMIPELPEAHTVNGIDNVENLEIFCPETLLHDTIRELFRNTARHLKDSTRPLNIWIESRQINDKINLTVRNDNSEISDRGGSGLQRLEDRLERFGAKLQKEPRPADGFATYRVDVEFVPGE